MRAWVERKKISDGSDGLTKLVRIPPATYLQRFLKHLIKRTIFLFLELIRPVNVALFAMIQADFIKWAISKILCM